MQTLLEYRRQKSHAEFIHARKTTTNDLIARIASNTTATSAQQPISLQRLPSTADLEDGEPMFLTDIKSGHHIHVQCDQDGKDQADPHNWSWSKRISTTFLLFLLVFSQGWVSACDSNVTKPMSATFHVSETAETLATALFILGISCGSLIVGPLSEELGRNPVYLVSSMIYICFTLGDALAPNFGAQITFRFLAGCFASPALSIYGGSLADMYSIEERQRVWPIFALSPLLSPVLSPVAGGWISDHISWRWVYWIGLILSFTIYIIALLFLPETFSPMIIQWRTHHLRQTTGDDKYTCDLEGRDSLEKRLRQNLTRPAKFFTTELIIISLGFYLVVVYVVLFTFLNGFEFIFKDTYGLSSGDTSLAFLGIGIGALVSTLLTPLVDHAYKRTRGDRSDDSDGEKPETLLVPAVVASPFFAISIFWLAWTNNPSISYWSDYTAIIVFGYAITAIFVSSYIYIINSYGTFSSSALGSITMARYLVSAGMVVAARPMYEGIGVHWSLTFLGCLAVVCLPVPLLIFRYGHILREKSQFINSAT